MVSWDYYNRFEAINDKYLPRMGEGDNMATQAVTAVNKLIFKWYNDGDVFDNTGAVEGWCNDLSSYANWLRANVPDTAGILDAVYDCADGGDYEYLLKNLADMVLDEALLDRLANEPKRGMVYSCVGPYRFVDYEDEGEE